MRDPFVPSVDETPDAARFDDLLRAAARACGAPIAIARGMDPQRCEAECLPFGLPGAVELAGAPGWVLAEEPWSPHADPGALRDLLRPLLPAPRPQKKRRAPLRPETQP